MWLSVILSFIGLTAIFLEFFLPGGIVAFIGGVFVIAGVSCAFLSDIAMQYKIFFFIANMVGTALCCKLALWLIKSRKGDQLCLESDQEGFTAHSLDQTFFGKIGEAQTDLKPSGHILLEGHRLQAVSEGDYIPKGKQIQIITGRGGYYIVKEKK